MKMRQLTSLQPFISLASAAISVNFSWEASQLAVNETANYPDIAFGDATGVNATYQGPKCRVNPGDQEWPTVEDWSKFNKTLGGVLLQPSPPGAVCYRNHPRYDAAQCAFLVSSARTTRFYSDDPVTILTDWPSGNPCVATRSPVGNCTQGGYPAFVVNATKVRHIQLAVNFARNRHLRLIIKNTGHEFSGRSTGAGSLSIWTHFLKDFEYIPEYSIDQYNGRVARVSAGIETWELYNYMDKYNMTMILPGGDTVGVFGGFIAGGGHNFLSSAYGHGADQILAFQVVTADGKYRSVTPHQNADLFFAMLGGGGSTYGVLTSAIVKVYPHTPVITLPLSFQVGQGTSPSNPNRTAPFPPNATFPAQPPNNRSRPTPTPSQQPIILNSTSLFWEAIHAYQYFAPTICDAGGTLYSYIRNLNNNTLSPSYSFTTRFELPNLTPQQAHDLVQPLYTSLTTLGIPVNNTILLQPSTPSQPAFKPKTGTGDAPGNNYFASRLFPRSNWSNVTIYNATFAAIRAVVEAGYTFHGINHFAPHSVAGYPGNLNAINPTWRAALMHADIFDTGFRAPSASMNSSTSGGFKSSHERLDKYMDLIRKVTPTGGAYYNEADVLEPNWQRAFFGAYYDRLVAVKRARDPWGLFWADTMPGSEGWRVVREEGGDGLPTQNGRLCLTGVEWEGEGE